jgi:DNA repair protein RadC
VSNLLHEYLKGTDREHFVVFFLDQKNRITGIHTVSMGSLTASVVHPREVFKAAILAQAAAIICGHNHPSGDVQPSREDRALTTRLSHAGKLLGIQLLDHIIIGHNHYFSFADEGLLDANVA